MNRWVVRFIGILMLLTFCIMFANLQRRLVELQQKSGPGPVSR